MTRPTEVAAATAVGEDRGMPATAPPRPRLARVRRSRSRVRRRVALLVTVAAAGAIAGIVAVATGRVSSVPAATCSVTWQGQSYALSPAQTANAATVSAVAVQAGLPNHAVTIALATALQESKLVNVGYGDRDSLGLFQQRPSQGWGTPAQIADPVYASGAFYRALTRLPHWESDSVAVAAQAVQHSADGTAYEQWEPEARAFAVALTGETPAGLACSGGVLSTAKATSQATRTQVTGALTAALGPDALVPPGTGRGWVSASWLVAHSQAYGITSVSYAGQTWTAARGAWAPHAAAGTTVSYALARPAA